jgi:hypothetical protein
VVFCNQLCFGFGQCLNIGRLAERASMLILLPDNDLHGLYVGGQRALTYCEEFSREGKNIMHCPTLIHSLAIKWIVAADKHGNLRPQMHWQIN